MEDNKKWYTSRTFWMNVFMALGMFATSVQVDIPEVELTAGAGGVAAIVNIILRFITRRGVSL